MKSKPTQFVLAIACFILIPLCNIYAQLGGNNCNSATLVTIPSDGSALTTTARYNTYTNASNQGLHPCTGILDPFESAPDTWFSFVSTTTEVLISSNTNSVSIFLYRGDCSQLTIVDYIAPGNSNPQCTPTSTHPFEVEIGETYYVQISFAGGLSDYDINFQDQANANNQDCIDAIPVSVTPGYNQDILVSSGQFQTSNIANSGCATGSNDAWYSFIAPECGAIEYSCYGSEGSIFEGTCGSLSLVECFSGQGITTNLAPGQTYYMQFTADDNQYYSDYLNIMPYLAAAGNTNLSCNTATIISTNQSYNLDITSTPFLPHTACADDIVAREIWYKFTAPASGNVNTYVNGATSEVYSGICGSLTQLACDDSPIYNNLNPGEKYYLRLLVGYQNTSNNINVEISSIATGQSCQEPMAYTVNNASCNSYTTVNLNSNFKTDPCSISPNTWVSFTAPISGSIKIECNNSNHFYNLYNDDCSNLNKIASYNGNQNTTYIHGLTSGQSYLLSIGRGNASTPLEFCISQENNTSSNKECSTATNVTSNTSFNFEIGKAAIQNNTVTDQCTDQPKALWYEFSATSTDMIIQANNIEYKLFKNSCSSQVELTEITFDADLIYENLTIGEDYTLQLFSNGYNDINAVEQVNVNDYARTITSYQTCAQALSIILNDNVTPYDIGASNSMSFTPLPSCLASGSGLVDSWVSFNAINTGVYLENINPDVTYVLYSGACGSITEVQCLNNLGNDFIQYNNLVQGNQYFLRSIAPGGTNITHNIAAKSPALNGNCNAATPLTINIAGNNPISISASDATSFVSNGACDSKTSLWYEFTCPIGGSVILQGHSGGIAVYSDDCNSLVEEVCDEVEAGNSYELNLTPGVDYLMRLSFDNYSDESAFTLIEGSPSTEETECSNAPLLSMSDMTCNMALSSTTNGILNTQGNFCGSHQKTAVFFQFTASTDANHAFELSNASANHNISIFENCTLGNALTCGNSPLDFNLVNGNTYIVAVYPANEGVTSNFDICVKESPAMDNGNVGISLSNPQAKLDVNGGIKPGFTNNQKSGNIRWNGDLEVYNGAEWKSLTRWDHTASQDIDMQNNRITNAQDPVDPSDVATKAYVDQFPNNDNSPTNELQTMSLVEDTLKMSHGAGYVVFDAFYDNEFNTDFSLATDNNISITDLGNTLSVNLDKYDNRWLYNSTTNELTYEEGNVGIYDSTPTQPLSVTGNIRSSNTDAESNYIEMSHDGNSGVINANGSDNFNIQHNADTKISITPSGNVGIGDDAPESKLTVTGKIRAAQDAAESNYAEISHNGTHAIINKLGSGNLLFQHAGNTRITMQPGGYVGIGDTGPSVPLAVTGIIRASANANENERTEIRHSGIHGIINTVGDGNLQLQHDGNTKVTIEPGGNVGISDSDPSAPLSVTGIIRASANANELERTEIRHSGSHGIINTVGDGNLQLQHDGNTRVTIEPTGHVGIGDTNPSTPLSVTGIIRASANANELERTEIIHNGLNGIINTVGDGNLLFQHDGNTKFSINDSGFLGINESNPQANLHINGLTNTDAILLFGGNTAIQHSNDLISAKEAALKFLLDTDNNNSNSQFELFSNVTSSIGNTPKVRFNLDGADSYFNTGGQLGVGVLNPSDQLHVQAPAASDAFRVQVGTQTKFRVYKNGSISLGSNNTNITDNNIYIATNLGIGDGNPTQPLSVTGTIRASFNANELEHIEVKHDGSNAIINTKGDGNLLFGHDDNDHMSLEPSGDLGIGTTAPEERLDIRGTTRIERNSTASTPHLKLMEDGNDYARIRFENNVETTNNWTLSGKADNTTSSNYFHIYCSADGGNSIMTLRGNGDVGINGTPSTDFHIRHKSSGTTDGLRIENMDAATTPWWRIYVSSTSSDLRLFSELQGSTIIGHFDKVNGSYSSISDRRHKHSIQSLHFDWDSFMQLNTYSYLFNNDDSAQRSIGLIAQELMPIYPELVSYEEDADQYLMNYSGLGVVAIKASQELKKEVEDLKKENEEMKKELAEIKALILEIQSKE